MITVNVKTLQWTATVEKPRLLHLQKPLVAKYLIIIYKIQNLLTERDES